MNIVKGDLLQLAREGHFDVIGHGCNCQNIMGAGIAKQVREQFPDAYKMDTSYHNEHHTHPFEMMGNYSQFYVWEDDHSPRFIILNMYTQVFPGADSPGCDQPFDYHALITALRKVNQEFKGLRIGLPWIGCGLAGGDKDKVRYIIERELTDMVVTIVEYENNKKPSNPMVAAGLGDASFEGENADSITGGGRVSDPLAGDYAGGNSGPFRGFTEDLD